WDRSRCRPRRSPRHAGRRQASWVKGSLVRRSERLIEIGDDVVDVLDADAETNRLWTHAGLALRVRRHLPMGGRGRMAGQRFGIPQFDEPFHQRQRAMYAASLK